MTPRLTPEQIRELRDLHSAGTPGEWVVGEPWSGFSRIEQRGGRVVCHTAPPEAANRKRLAVDHQLIVKARNALPALLDEVESLRGEVERLRRVRDAAERVENQKSEPVNCYADALRHESSTKELSDALAATREAERLRRVRPEWVVMLYDRDDYAGGRAPASMWPRTEFDGQTWPVPGERMDEVEWQLRYGEPTAQERLIAASVLAAYRTLINCSSAKRNQVASKLRARTLAATKEHP